MIVLESNYSKKIGLPRYSAISSASPSGPKSPTSPKSKPKAHRLYKLLQDQRGRFDQRSRFPAR